MRIIRYAIQVAVCAVLAGLPAIAQQSTGYLKTKVNPGRAGVFIDGKYVGPAANFGIGRKYAVAPGQHEIRLSEPRYEDIVAQVTIEAGKTTKLSQTMKALPAPQPPFGVLRTISSDKFAAVYVNGKFMGHVDEFSNSSQGLQLNPGDYSVKIAPVNGPEGKEERVKIEADKTTIVRN